MEEILFGEMKSNLMLMGCLNVKRDIIMAISIMILLTDMMGLIALLHLHIPKQTILLQQLIIHMILQII